MNPFHFLIDSNEFFFFWKHSFLFHRLFIICINLWMGPNWPFWINVQVNGVWAVSMVRTQKKVVPGRSLPPATSISNAPTLITSVAIAKQAISLCTCLIGTRSHSNSHLTLMHWTLGERNKKQGAKRISPEDVQSRPPSRKSVHLQKSTRFIAKEIDQVGPKGLLKLRVI